MEKALAITKKILFAIAALVVIVSVFFVTVIDKPFDETTSKIVITISEAAVTLAVTLDIFASWKCEKNVSAYTVGFDIALIILIITNWI